MACEDYYTEDQLVDGLCPVHGRPVIEMEEDNYFFKLSAFEDRLLEYYDSHPDFVRPASKRNEALGFIQGGLRDISITRTSFTWGVPVPWDSGHVFYVWYDALINYLTVAGYGGDEGEFADRWGAAHHLIGKDILNFHCVWWPAMCMAAGIEPPSEIFVHGCLLMGGQKLGKTMIAPGSPARRTRHARADHRRLAARAGRRLRGRPAALPPAARGAARQRRRLLLRGDRGPVQRGPGQQPRQPGVAGGDRGALEVRWHRPGPGPGARWPRSRQAVLEAATAAWARWAPHEALEETWRLIGAANAELEVAEPWKNDPGPAVDAVLGDALEVLRIVARPRRAGDAVHRGGGLAPHRPSRATPTTARLPAPRRGAATAAGRGGEGRPAVPAAQGLTMAGWFDSHCHVQEEFLRGEDETEAARGRIRRPRAPGPGPRRGVDRLICIGTGVTTSAQAVGAGPGHRPGGARAVGLGVHRPASARGERGLDAVADLLAGWRRVTARRGGGGVRARLLLRALAARRAARRLRRADRARRTRTVSRSSSTRATRGTTSSTSLDAEGVPARTILHCFTGGPDEATGVCAPACPCRSAAS